MNIILISIHTLALGYLKDSFNISQYKKVILITDKLTKELKSFLMFHEINFIITKNLSLKTLDKLDLVDNIVLSAGSPWIFKKDIIKGRDIKKVMNE